MEAFLSLLDPGALSHLELQAQEGVYLTKWNQAELQCDD